MKIIIRTIKSDVKFHFQNSFEQWRPVFFVGASVYIVSAIFFILFGTADIQLWNFPKGDKADGVDLHSNGDFKDINNATIKNGDTKEIKETPLTVTA